jgi:hypothetical protein
MLKCARIFMIRVIIQIIKKKKIKVNSLNYERLRIPLLLLKLHIEFSITFMLPEIKLTFQLKLFHNF